MSDDDFQHLLRNKLTIVKGYLDMVSSADIAEKSRKWMKEAKDELASLVDKLSGENKDRQ